MKKIIPGVGYVLGGVITGGMIALLYIYLSEIYEIHSFFTNSIAMKVITPIVVAIFAIGLYMLILIRLGTDAPVWQQIIAASSLTVYFFYFFTIVLGTILNLIFSELNIPIYCLVAACIVIGVMVVGYALFNEHEKDKKRKKKKTRTKKEKGEKRQKKNIDKKKKK